MPKYEWVPPRRNTEDPNFPALPGMPQMKAPRIHPGHPLYHQAHNSEVWGELAHPDLREHNPFLNGVNGSDDENDYAGRSWRQESGGYADRYEDAMDSPEGHPARIERRVQSIFDKAHPAIAISRHPLTQVLKSGRLKSQFETSTSNGSLDPDSRREVEHQFFGYPHDLPDRARPIYGYLTHNPLQHHPAASGYGEHTLILHRPRIWHRTSAFLGDTLGDSDEGHSAHPVQDFQVSGFPRHENPNNYRLDQTRSWHEGGSQIDYTEAQYHGGVGLRDIHYAVLHRPEAWLRHSNESAIPDHEELKHRLNQHRIPWVEVDRGEPVHWEHRLGRMMATVNRGAHMHQNARIVGQQGEDRYLIDLGYDDEHGHRQAQIADVGRGELHPPMAKDSILARGYWEDPDTDLEAHDVLPLVHPV